MSQRASASDLPSLATLSSLSPGRQKAKWRSLLSLVLLPAFLPAYLLFIPPILYTHSLRTKPMVCSESLPLKEGSCLTVPGNSTLGTLAAPRLPPFLSTSSSSKVKVSLMLMACVQVDLDRAFTFNRDWSQERTPTALLHGTRKQRTIQIHTISHRYPSLESFAHITSSSNVATSLPMELTKVSS